MKLITFSFYSTSLGHFTLHFKDVVQELKELHQPIHVMVLLEPAASIIEKLASKLVRHRKRGIESTSELELFG